MTRIGFVTLLCDKINAIGNSRLARDYTMSSPNPGLFTRGKRRLCLHLRRSLIAGSLVLVPVALTYLVLKFIFDIVDSVLSPGIRWVFNQYFGVEWSVPGAGFILAILVIYLSGFIAANTLGLKLTRLIQNAVLKTPVIGSIYSAARKLVESFSPGSGQTGFKRVVMLQYPREGYWSMGFLTAITTSGGQQFAIVYIPTAPLPNSGWVAIVPVSEVYDTDLDVQDAMQLVFSGGIVSPESIQSGPLILDSEDLKRNPATE